MKKYFILLVLALCFLLLPQRVWAADYYVSTSGNDANSGTTSSPWKTIQKAANTMVAGDTAYVKNDGVYYEMISFKNSGTSSNYIRYIGLSDQNNNKPVIDAIGKWVAIRNNSGEGTGKSYLEINNFEIRNGGVNAGGGYGIQIGGGAKFVRLLNLNIHDNYNSGIAIGDNNYGTSNIYINKVKSYRNGKGSNGGHGIILYKGGDNSEISDSVFYDNGQDGGTDVWSSGIEINKVSGVTIKNNISYHNMMHGIDVCQYAYNNTITGNVTYNNAHVGIGVDIYAHDNYVAQNLVYKNGTTKTWGNNNSAGAGIYLWDNANNNTIVNNTIYGTLYDWGICFSDTSIGNVLKNNVTYANSSGSLCVTNKQNITSSDYNDFGENKFCSYSSFESYRTNVGQDTHSKTVNPLFVDATNNDFHLQSGSPLINAGTDVGLPYSGSAPDIGALEYNPGNLPSPSPSPSSLSLFRFAAFSDTHSDPNKSSNNSTVSLVSDQISVLNPSFVVVAGDIVENGFDLTSMNIWKQAVNGEFAGGNSPNGLTNKTFPVRGNHDWQKISTLTGWQNFFNMGNIVSGIGAKNYSYLTGEDDITYSFDFGNSHFVGIDIAGNSHGYPDYGIETLTLNRISWLDADLTAAENRGLTHAFLFFHGPFYCIGADPNAAAHVCPPSCPIGARSCTLAGNMPSMVSVLNKHQIISAVIAGHEGITPYTHVDGTRMPGLTHPFEQFVVANTTYTNYCPTSEVQRFDYCEAGKHGFITIDVSGLNYTVKWFDVNSTTPYHSISFTKSGVPNTSPGACPLKSLGDFNCDGKINESDLNALLGSWSTSGKDLTGDGKTNESDLNKLLGNWKAF